jgi:hypothetical protein
VVFIFNNNLFNSIKSINENRNDDMTDKVKQIIWVFDVEENRKKRIQLQTLLDRANHSFRHENIKYFALEKDRDSFAKEGYVMSDFNWCHGPECHTKHTQDRVRGVKGSKVLRTRKIKLNQWNSSGQWGFFCSNHCQNDFWKTYATQIVAIAPRTECS